MDSKQKIKNLENALIQLIRRDAAKTAIIDGNIVHTDAVDNANRKTQSDVEYIAMMSDIELD